MYSSLFMLLVISFNYPYQSHMHHCIYALLSLIYFVAIRSSMSKPLDVNCCQRRWPSNSNSRSRTWSLCCSTRNCLHSASEFRKWLAACCVCVGRAVLRGKGLPRVLTGLPPRRVGVCPARAGCDRGSGGDWDTGRVGVMQPENNQYILS